MAMIPGRDCVWDDDRIERYSRQTLPLEEAAGLEEHLLVCEVCQARLAAEDAYAHAMRHAALQLCQAKRREVWFRFFPGLLAPVACVAMVMLLALAGWHWIHPAAAAPALAVKLEAMRGAEPGSKAPAGHPLTFQADLAGLPPAGSYPLELVDREGRAVWKGSTANPTIAPLRPGLYFLRVFSGHGQLLREYGLEIQVR
ncbi:MAG TPA: hypothetical protein VME43_03835 [Bryobacteraceae bacterium]|nr:hypothetical protein [Bryobacteraceae bacterium]